jgi:hypothetical protein
VVALHFDGVPTRPQLRVVSSLIAAPAQNVSERSRGTALFRVAPSFSKGEVR